MFHRPWALPAPTPGDGRGTMKSLWLGRQAPALPWTEGDRVPELVRLPVDGGR